MMHRVSSLLKSTRFLRVRGPIVFIGDIHGSTDKLKRLWDKIIPAVGGEDPFSKLNVVFLGDYCDKGPDTKGTVDFLVSLKEEYPLQHQFFLCGNHDFALQAFLGILPEGGKKDNPKLVRNHGDYSKTWRQQYKTKYSDEILYEGPGHEIMHLQGKRYAANPYSVFDSQHTFESYGVKYGDREGLFEAMPDTHLKFFTELQWTLELRSHVGDIIAVHAGLEDEALPVLDKTIQSLRARDKSFLHLPWLEPICGRSNVEAMPQALKPPILRKRGVLPPPLFLISGHHGFVRVNQRRIILDMHGGHANKEIAALILNRKGTGKTSHDTLSNEQGLSVSIVTSAK